MINWSEKDTLQVLAGVLAGALIVGTPTFFQKKDYKEFAREACRGRLTEAAKEAGFTSFLYIGGTIDHDRGKKMCTYTGENGQFQFYYPPLSEKLDSGTTNSAPTP